MSDFAKLLVTGATGQLGRLVIETLLQTIAADRIVGLVRNVTAAGDLTQTGIELRVGDYDRPETLSAAFAGIDRMLLISGNIIGQRLPQHRNAIEAAQGAGVRFIAYTSILHADSAGMELAGEHIQTETLLRKSGVPYAILRNGWYTENDLAALPGVLAHGAVVGSSGDGRIAWATRADYAAAAAAVLTASDEQAGHIYELAGDEAYTRAHYAAEIARQAGQPVVYRDLPPAEFEAAVREMGLPADLARIFADSDVAFSKSGFFDDGHQLRALIGRPTTPLAVSMATALQNLKTAATPGR